MAKSQMIICLIFLFSLAIFLFAPHHRRNFNTLKATTLSEIYLDFFREMPNLLESRTQFIFVLGLAGIAAAFYPAVLVFMVKALGTAPGEIGGAWFVIGGLFCATGAAVNFLAILVSHMTFGFGGSSADPDATPLAWMIPLLQFSFSIVSVAIGASAWCASLAARCINA